MQMLWNWVLMELTKASSGVATYFQGTVEQGMKTMSLPNCCLPAMGMPPSSSPISVLGPMAQNLGSVLTKIQDIHLQYELCFSHCGNHPTILQLSFLVIFPPFCYLKWWFPWIALLSSQLGWSTAPIRWVGNCEDGSSLGGQMTLHEMDCMSMRPYLVTEYNSSCKVPCKSSPLYMVRRALSDLCFLGWGSPGAIMVSREILIPNMEILLSY